MHSPGTVGCAVSVSAPDRGRLLSIFCSFSFQFLQFYFLVVLHFPSFSQVSKSCFPELKAVHEAFQAFWGILCVCPSGSLPGGTAYFFSFCLNHSPPLQSIWPNKVHQQFQCAIYLSRTNPFKQHHLPQHVDRWAKTSR